MNHRLLRTGRFSASRLSLVIAAFALASLTMNAVAADAPVGTVTGTVTDIGDKPAAGIVVTFYGKTENPKRGGRRSTDFQPEPIALAANAAKGKATTDASGKFEIKTLPAGTYQFRAGAPTNKTGMKSGEVTVEAGKSVTLDIKLDPQAAK